VKESFKKSHDSFEKTVARETPASQSLKKLSKRHTKTKFLKNQRKARSGQEKPTAIIIIKSSSFIVVLFC
jgi:hypothetical protein